MPPAKNDRRYQDILNKIACRGPVGSKSPVDKPQTPQDSALDLINAYDSLIPLAERSYDSILCYGPNSLRRSAWSAVVIWYQNKGYHGYQTLDLLGVWAHYAGTQIMLSIGIRKLQYCAPIFDAGVYRVAIKNGFQLYYEDDGRPPEAGDSPLYHEPFKMEKRLTHRRALCEILDKWQDGIEFA